MLGVNKPLCERTRCKNHSYLSHFMTKPGKINSAVALIPSAIRLNVDGFDFSSLCISDLKRSICLCIWEACSCKPFCRRASFSWNTTQTATSERIANHDFDLWRWLPLEHSKVHDLKESVLLLLLVWLPGLVHCLSSFSPALFPSDEWSD